MVEKEKCWMTNTCNRIDCDSPFCMKLYKLSYLYEQSLISMSQRRHIGLKVDSDGTDTKEFTQLKEIETNIETFVSEGNNLYIHSQIAGNGKTSWALRMVESYFNKIWPKSDLTCRALFINVPRFLIALKDSIATPSQYINHIKENIEKADIVVWDDIGHKSITEFESSNLLSMIDMRMSSNKTNIFTSNLSEEEMHQCLGDRLSSRVCNSSTNIELRGADKRGIK